MATMHKSYLYWLAGTALGVCCVVSLLNRKKASALPARFDDVLDDASEASFPASDPPAWTGTHA